MQNAERSGVKKRLNIGIQEDLKYQLFFLPDNIINSFVYTFSFNLHSKPIRLVLYYCHLKDEKTETQRGQIAKNGAGAQTRQFSSRAHENKGLGKGYS